MTRRFVITGTGRCGTMWAAEALRACGINCGHQDVFRHEHTLGRPFDWKDYEGDCSYEAVPLLHTLPDDVVKVVLVREPLAVMRSWRGLGLFVDKVDTWDRWGLLSRVLDRHFPEVTRYPDPMGRAALYWLHWNNTALTNADYWARVERTSTASLLMMLSMDQRHDVAALSVPRNTNTRADEKVDRGPHSWEDVPADVRDDVYSFARELGYYE